MPRVERSPSLFHMFIREDRKSVIFARTLTFDLRYQQETRSPQNQSYNFNLLSMPRVKRFYHGLKQTLDRGKSMCLLGKTVSPSFFKKSLVSQAAQQ